MTNTTNSIAASAYPASAGAQNFAEISAKANFANSEVKDSQESGRSQNDHISALKFITCGSVDDGKSTLIGRLLVDSKAVLQDHLAGVQRQPSS